MSELPNPKQALDQDRAERLTRLHELAKQARLSTRTLAQMVSYARVLGQVIIEHVAALPAEEQRRYLPIYMAAQELDACVLNLAQAQHTGKNEAAVLEGIQLGQWVAEIDRLRHRPGGDPTECIPRAAQVQRLFIELRAEHPDRKLTGPRGVYALVGQQLSPPQSGRTVRRILKASKPR